ncbi:hypothetical protein J8I87_11565 [Paraburkholderia sp. LEh10]|uniref:hypothetical protein n=1 Tax=Paraburkholderia sp. LEh10 TaxID=2821353 RepID=UPI001AE8D135|nr:hypothetical protein [Paraburkholderia sp. LEh10]MBP0590337.1 hypothetical protein [Paraburkholderia sp. LEh10]
MMTTRKIVMILVGLLLGAAGTTYLMLLQADRRATAEATAGMDESTPAAAVDSRVSESHVTEGSISMSRPSSAVSKSTAVTQQPVLPAPAPAPVPAPAAVAPAPSPSTAAIAPAPSPAPAAEQPKPQLQPAQPSTAVASIHAPDAGAPKVVPSPRTQRGRDSLERRTPAALQGPTPETDELVRESAKLDPSLPPPASMPPVDISTDANPGARPSTNQHGSSQSGAAMTNQLVRHPAKTDPSLPPPDMSAVRTATEQRIAKPGAGSNPVAAAMTEQLVRDSAKLDPSLPPPK